MNTVGVRELKTRLGRYLGLVRGGATLIVTDRGRPVAELRPIAPKDDDEEAVLAELAALGEVSLGLGTPLEPFEPFEIGGLPLAETIVEEREDRF